MSAPVTSMDRLLAILAAQGALSTPYVKSTHKAKGRGYASQTIPRFELLLPGEAVYVDMEFLKYDDPAFPTQQHRVAWIATLNSRGEVILDTFVRYKRNPDFVIQYGGPKHVRIDSKMLWEENGAVEAEVVEEWCARIFKDRPVVIWGGSQDLTAFKITKPFEGASQVIDAQNFYNGRGLKKMSIAYLGVEIQIGLHSPVEDAMATMLLYYLTLPARYDRAPLVAAYESMSASEKAAYLATGPVVLPRHYYSTVGPCPFVTTNPGGSSRGGRGGRGGFKGRGNNTQGGQSARNGTGIGSAQGASASRGGSEGARGGLGGQRGGRGGQGQRGGAITARGGSAQANSTSATSFNVDARRSQGNRVTNVTKSSSNATRGGGASRGRGRGNL